MFHIRLIVTLKSIKTLIKIQGFYFNTRLNKSIHNYLKICCN